MSREIQQSNKAPRHHNDNFESDKRFIETVAELRTITSSQADFSVKDIYERARDNDKILMSKGYSLGVLTKETRDNTVGYKGQIDYEIRRPGRIQFIDKEKSQCQFFLFGRDKGEWQVEVDGTRTQDGRKFKSCFQS